MARLQPKTKIYDVVVIGSGAGGGTVVHTLTKMGVEAALLEAGPMVDPSKDFKEHMWPYEVDHQGAEEGASYYFGRQQWGYFRCSQWILARRRRTLHGSSGERFPLVSVPDSGRSNQSLRPDLPAICPLRT